MPTIGLLMVFALSVICSFGYDETTRTSFKEYSDADEHIRELTEFAAAEMDWQSMYNNSARLDRFIHAVKMGHYLQIAFTLRLTKALKIDHWAYHQLYLFGDLKPRVSASPSLLKRSL